MLVIYYMVNMNVCILKVNYAETMFYVLPVLLLLTVPPQSL